MAEADPAVGDPAVGIDLGTTFSCVAVFVNGKPKVLSNAHGNRITPSCVAFTDNGFLIGEEARYKLTINPTRTVYHVKRLMGRTFDDPLVQDDISHWSFDVVNDDGKPKIKVLSDNELKFYSPEEISSMILVKMKELAEEFLKKPVTKAVVTVPAYFNDSQRQATKTAAKLAGLEVLRIINEPTAAAIAYGLKKISTEKLLLMFDLGGGTFDVSVLQVGDGILQVLATGGDTHLGGADFDNRMVDKLANFFNSKMSLKEQVTTDVKKTLKHRLARAVEFAKCQISTDNKSSINIDDFHENKDFNYDIYREEFEETNQDLFQKTIKHVQIVLDDAGLTVNEIDEVVLVGGSTRIPMIQKLLQEFFNGKKLNKSINPDEAVACGAAIEAAVLVGVADVDDILLMDVTSLSLGVETKGGLVSKILDKNTPIPARGNEEYTTVSDNQERVRVAVFQGEHPLARDNHFLGEFTLDGIESAPAGVPTIDESFDIDADGILQVTAKDKRTGAKQSIKIDRNKSHLSEQDISKMLEQAHKHKKEDHEEKRRIVARNVLQIFVNWIRYLINDKREKLRISDDYCEDIMEKCQETEAWWKENEHASTDEHQWQYDIINDICKDLPPDYMTPGELPGGSRVRNYNKHADSLNTKLNDCISDDEDVNELD